MTLTLTPHQRAYIAASPVPEGAHNKIRLALKQTPGNQDALAREADIAYPQLGRYLDGGDLLLSTAFRIAAVFGVDVCDLWPHPPAAKRKRISKSTAKGKRPVAKRASKGAKAQVAA